MSSKWSENVDSLCSLIGQKLDDSAIRANHCDVVDTIVRILEIEKFSSRKEEKIGQASSRNNFQIRDKSWRQRMLFSKLWDFQGMACRKMLEFHSDFLNLIAHNI